MLKIGNAPLKKLDGIQQRYSCSANIFAKLESFNAGGSVKDRIALKMIEMAEKEGKIKKGGVFIEPTSGNTGIGISLIAKDRGYRALIVMPESMSIERREMIKSYGGELVLTEAKLGMKGAIAKAKELNELIKMTYGWIKNG